MQRFLQELQERNLTRIPVEVLLAFSLANDQGEAIDTFLDRYLLGEDVQYDNASSDPYYEHYEYINYEGDADPTTVNMTTPLESTNGTRRMLAGRVLTEMLREANGTMPPKNQPIRRRRPHPKATNGTKGETLWHQRQRRPTGVLTNAEYIRQFDRINRQNMPKDHEEDGEKSCFHMITCTRLMHTDVEDVNVVKIWEVATMTTTMSTADVQTKKAMGFAVSLNSSTFSCKTVECRA